MEVTSHLPSKTRAWRAVPVTAEADLPRSALQRMGAWCPAKLPGALSSES